MQNIHTNNTIEAIVDTDYTAGGVVAHVGRINNNNKYYASNLCTEHPVTFILIKYCCKCSYLVSSNGS